MLAQTVLLGAFSLLCAAARNPYGDFKTFESLHSAPDGWKAVGQPASESRLKFSIALNSADPDALVNELRAISSPDSPRYGQHLKRDELTHLIRPSASGKAAVHQWLKRAGVSDIQDRGEWVHFTASAAQADAMMNTKFLVYRHVEDSGAEAVRTTRVALPRSIAPHVKMVHPTTRFAQLRPQRSRISEISEITNSRVVELLSQAPNQSCNNTITPACLRELYNIKGVTIQDPSKVGFLGVAGFLKQYARYSDLKRFTAGQAPWATSANFSWTSVNGGVLPQDSPESASEANLDIQYTVALSHPLPNNFYSTPGLGELVPDLDQPDINSNQNEPYLEFFQWLSKQSQLPHTISFSYGENEQSVPPSYAQSVCDLIGQLGARGVSVIFSSGDTGVGSACQTNDGKKTTRFLPTFPAACPYVTSIGGTVGVNPERAVGFSSGGFSDKWPRPWYQEKQVTSYLKALGPQWSGLYNPQGRGFPDISAQGVNFVIYDGGRAKKISGTSASAPAIAGMIGLLNAQRLQNGKPALGFLNPWIYQSGADMLTDIVDGGSTGCTGYDQYSGLRTPRVPDASWAAVPGWDPVTGMGTPKFDQMLRLLPMGPTQGIAPPGTGAPSAPGPVAPGPAPRVPTPPEIVVPVPASPRPGQEGPGPIMPVPLQGPGPVVPTPPEVAVPMPASPRPGDVGPGPVIPVPMPAPVAPGPLPVLPDIYPPPLMDGPWNGRP